MTKGTFPALGGTDSLERQAMRCLLRACRRIDAEPTHPDGWVLRIRRGLGRLSTARFAFIGQETAAAGRQLSRSRNAMVFTFTSLVKPRVVIFVIVEMEGLVSVFQFLYSDEGSIVTVILGHIGRRRGLSKLGQHCSTTPLAFHAIRDELWTALSVFFFPCSSLSYFLSF